MPRCLETQQVRAVRNRRFSMNRTHHSEIEKRRRTRRAFALSASAIIGLCLAGPMSSIAWAQSSSAPILDSQHPEVGPLPAPVGHRQPRRKDLPANVTQDPANVTQDEDDALARQRAFDKSLNICRC